MGVGLDDAHHMGCGSKRVSNTYRDRDLYEVSLRIVIATNQSIESLQVRRGYNVIPHL